MGARHSGREAALQMLFQMELSGSSPEVAIELFWRSFDEDRAKSTDESPEQFFPLRHCDRQTDDPCRSV